MPSGIRPVRLLWFIVLFGLWGCAVTASESQNFAANPQLAPSSQATSSWKFVYGRYISDTQVLEIVSVPPAKPVNAMVLTSFNAGFAGNRVALSHSKRLLAYTRLPQGASARGRADAELWLADISTQEVRRLAAQVEVGRYTHYPLWSPDDQWIVFYRKTVSSSPYEQQIVSIDTETAQETILVSQTVSLQETEGSDFIYPLDWSPDGQYLYYQRGLFGTVDLWRVAPDSDRAPKRIGTISEAGTPRCYYVSGDGQNLLCSVQKTNGTSLITIDLASGQVTTLTDNALNYVSDPLWKPDGQAITVGVQQREDDMVTAVQTIDLHGILVAEAAMATSGKMNPCSWSPDGVWLAGFVVTDVADYLVLSNQDDSVLHRIDDAVSQMCIGWIQ